MKEASISLRQSVQGFDEAFGYLELQIIKYRLSQVVYKLIEKMERDIPQGSRYSLMLLPL